MNERYIAIYVSPGGGEWGAGGTIEEAKKHLKKAGGKVKNCKIIRFTSELPFAPNNRDATEEEADSWVGQDGSLNWIRCKREEITSDSQATH